MRPIRLLRSPRTPAKPTIKCVDINGVVNRHVRTFGAEHLCCQVLGKLGLKQALLARGMSQDKARLGLMSIAGRALFGASEHKTAAWLASQTIVMDAGLATGIPSSILCWA